MSITSKLKGSGLNVCRSLPFKLWVFLIQIMLLSGCGLEIRRLELNLSNSATPNSGTPQLVWALTSHDFGSIASGAHSSSQVFILDNAGSAAATSCFAPTLSNSADFEIIADTCGTSDLAANANCSVTVRARPASAGAKSTTLSRSCNRGGVASTLMNEIKAIGLAPSALAWDLLDHDFASVLTGSSTANQVFVLTNSGGTDASGCSAPTLSNSTDFSIITDGCQTNDLPASGSCSVAIRANPATSGSKASTLSRSCSSGGTAVTTSNGITVVGLAPAALAWTPLTHAFGNIAVGANSSVETFTLSNSGGVPATGCSAPTLSNSTDFSIVTDGCATGNVAASGSCTVTVRANPGSAGAKTATLSRVCTTGGTASTTANQITTTGFVPAALAWTPLTHAFGNIAVGANSSVETFTLSNSGGVAATSCSAPTLSNTTDFSIVTDGCATSNVAASGSCTVTVRANPGSTGAKTATLSRVCTSGGTASTTANQITTTGFIPAALAWTPLTHSFGSIAVGSNSSAETFTLTNSGGVAATGCSAPTLSNSTDFSIVTDGCATGNVAASGSCTVTVRANPGSAGAKTATLSRVCTTGGTASTTANQITTTGFIPAALAWTPLTHGFGNIEVGEDSSTQTFTLSNSGGVAATSCSAPTLSNTTDFSIVTDNCSTNNVSASGSCTVIIKGNPASGGAKTTTLSRVCTSGGTASTTANQITVTGSTPVTLAWSPLTHNFGNVAEGETSSGRVFTLTNSGGSPATGCSAPTLSNSTDFRIVSDGCRGSNVSGSGNCTVTVQGISTTLGAKTTTLSRTCTVGGTVSTTANQITMNGTLAPVRLSDNRFSYYFQRDLTHRFKAYGGTGGYTYSIVSGPGSIDTSTGVYTSSIGERSPGTSTVIRVTDSSGSNATSTIDHIGFSTDGTVNTMVSDGTSIYMGGSFTHVNPHGVRGWVGVDRNTGEISRRGILKRLNGPVYASVVSGSSIFLGGTFTRYGTSTVENIIKVDLRTGNLDTTFTKTTGPDGPVYALAISGSDLYVGGDFEAYRGNENGAYLIKLNASTAAMDTTFNSSPGPDNFVNSILVAGSSLYIGGRFTEYKGDANGGYLAKIHASTAALDTSFNSTTGPNGEVFSLAQTDSHLYVGGSFANYRGNTNGRNLAKVDRETGDLDTTFNSTAGPNGLVQTVKLDGSVLYIGGEFGSYRATANTAHLAKINASNGSVVSAFHSAAGPNNAFKNTIYDIVLSGSDLYVAGRFQDFRGNAAGSVLAKIDSTTGAIDTGFNSTPDRITSLLGSSYHTEFRFGVYSLQLIDSDLYIMGSFTGYGEKENRRQGLAKIDRTTGDLDPDFFKDMATTIDHSGDPKGAFHALALHGSTLFVGGDFTEYNGNTNGARLAKIDAATGDLNTTFNSAVGPNSSSVRAIAFDGTSLFVGGGFTKYRESSNGRYLAKVNPTTGALITAFNSATGPNGEVNAIAFDGTSLFVGGGFSSYRNVGNGRYLAKLDPTNGALDTTFNSAIGPSTTVNTLAFDGTSLYAGGEFTKYRDAANGRYLAKINPTDGTLDTTFNSTTGPNSAVHTLSLSGSHLFAGGLFSSYRGSTNGRYLVKLDPTSGERDTTFNSTGGPNNSVSSLLHLGSDLYFSGTFTGYRSSGHLPGMCSVDDTSGDLLIW